MCFNAELFIKWFIFIISSPSPPVPSLLSHIIHEKPWWIYFMHKTFRAGRDDHYLSHLEALPDKSFLEVDRPLKCSHWVREMNSSCVLLFQQLGKGDHGALEYKQTAGTHSWDKRHLFSWTAGLFKFNLHGINLLGKENLWFPEKPEGWMAPSCLTWIFSWGLWERKDSWPRQNGFCQRCFKNNSWYFSSICDLVWSAEHLRGASDSSTLVNSASNWIKLNFQQKPPLNMKIHPVSDIKTKTLHSPAKPDVQGEIKLFTQP